MPRSLPSRERLLGKLRNDPSTQPATGLPVVDVSSFRTSISCTHIDDSSSSVDAAKTRSSVLSRGYCHPHPSCETLCFPPPRDSSHTRSCSIAGLPSNGIASTASIPSAPFNTRAYPSATSSARRIPMSKPTPVPSPSYPRRCRCSHVRDHARTRSCIRTRSSHSLSVHYHTPRTVDLPSNGGNSCIWNERACQTAGQKKVKRGVATFCAYGTGGIKISRYHRDLGAGQLKQ
ncbi:hypothetical protein EDD16DRAFT_836429 [Pisolithus croceorrhizus]|nr:hypothetical protein EDD16DRAFT_836429 [Pisolithus croceorrhizus]KAI6169888.1 hypothetical protein EDD17DRAFT_1892159 [Pisolithus thermaeus]